MIEEMTQVNMKAIKDINKLSQGEHKLEDVLKMAGFKEEKQKPHVINENYCSICNSELNIEWNEDWDETGFVVWPYFYCPKCKTKVER